MKHIYFILLLVLTSTGFCNNKVTILYEQDPTLLTSNIYAVLLSGGMADPVDKTGLSSMFATLMTRGTKKMSRSEFQSLTERLGGSISGSSSVDSMIFSGNIIKENTFKLIELLAQTLTEPALSQSEFDKLKKEMVADTYAILNNNGRLGGLALRKEIFKGTVFERPLQGTLKTISAITLSDIKQKYDSIVNRKNLFFAVSSPYPEEEIRPKLEAIWNHFKEGTLDAPFEVPMQIPSTPTLVLVDKPGTATGSIAMAQAGITVNDKDRFLLGLSDYSFGGGGFVSRLFGTVRAKLGYTYSIGSTYQATGALNKQKGLYAIFSTPSIEFTAKALFKTLDLWHTYLQSGVNSDELSLAQDSLINAYPFNFESARSRLALKVANHLYDVPVLSYEEHSKTLRDIKVSDIPKILQKHHTQNGWIITIVADKKIIEKQLKEEQKDIPEKERLTISKVIVPASIIQ